MTTNQQLAETFRSIADLLDLKGERFKPEAYRRAGRSIESLPEDVRALAQRGELDSIPGVGAAIAEKIREFLKDGTIAYYERLKQEVPPGVLEIMRLGGVGPKTARRFLLEFGIEGPQELSAAIDAGRFQGVKGFGDRKVELLKQALAAGTKAGDRLPLRDAWRIAERLMADLSRAAPLDQIAVAGSLRRRRESIGDLDILVTASAPEAVFDAFSALPDVTEVKLRGPTKETVVLNGRLQVDLRVVEPAAFGAALQYFTGSKDHNVHVRTLARDRGLKVNEYGVFKDEERVAGTTEKDVYTVLGLPWIPPEIRENHGEIEAAASGTLPALVEPTDVRGDLHVHLRADSTSEEVDRRLDEAVRRGWTFVGFVVESPEGKSGPALLSLIRRRREERAGAFRVLLGSEGPPDAPSSLPEAEYRILDVSALSTPPKGTASRRDPPLFLAHLSLARPGSEATPDTTRAWVDWAHRSKVGMEVSPGAAADGIDSTGVHQAVEARVPLHVTAGVRAVSDDYATMELAVGLARRGWAGPRSLLNREAPSPRRPGPAG